MNPNSLEQIARLRLAVGCAGEKSAPAWWKTSFFSEQSAMFLSPLFPRSQWAARASALTECAARIHDEHIGVSQRVFHLFRLPEFMEQSICESMLVDGFGQAVEGLVTSPEGSKEILRQYATDSPKTPPGPARLGDIDSVATGAAVGPLAACYLHAIEGSYEVFPFFTEKA